MSSEDDDADTPRPRFDQLGGDPSRIHSLQFVHSSEKGREGVAELQDRNLDLGRDLKTLRLLVVPNIRWWCS